MDEKRRTASSKFLSYVLRHNPESIGVSLDPAGWVNVDVLLDACAKSGRRISLGELMEVVAKNPKKRFAVTDDGACIRANQGHTTIVDLGYEPTDPPDVLFHGTVARLLSSILDKGLLRMQRHHVHLSSDVETACAVGGRRGKPLVLLVDSRSMREEGFLFYRTPNGVWLTEAVPAKYISCLDEE